MSVTPVDRAVPFGLSWFVHPHMESTLCFAREETSPSQVQRSVGQNKGQA